ncbi:MAG: Mrp/NBP35 family ATP-binding protein [Thermoprotei archaeon]
MSNPSVDGEKRILEALKSVVDPELGENIVDLDMVKKIEFDGGRVSLTVSLTVPGCPLQNRIRRDVAGVLAGLGVEVGKIEFTYMTQEEQEALVKKIREMRSRRIAQNRELAAGGLNPIARLPKGSIHTIIAVASGKGGVGKSFVTALLAVELRRKGYNVGILDADITGPSQAKLFGLRDRLTTLDGKKIQPALTESGIKVVSMNLILEKETDATIWRGPIVSNIIRQFYTDVDWGGLDYLLVDLPPGTSDAPLTVFQSIPLDGVIVVVSPQELARMVVAKAVNMAKKLNVPILGVIENMAYAVCPHCGEVIKIFGEPQGEAVAEEFGVAYLGGLPLDPEVSRLSDQGRVEDYSSKVMEEVLPKISTFRVTVLNEANQA